MQAIIIDLNFKRLQMRHVEPFRSYLITFGEGKVFLDLHKSREVIDDVPMDVLEYIVAQETAEGLLKP
jgi:hypothetical protein